MCNFQCMYHSLSPPGHCKHHSGSGTAGQLKEQSSGCESAGTISAHNTYHIICMTIRLVWQEAFDLVQHQQETNSCPGLCWLWLSIWAHCRTNNHFVTKTHSDYSVVHNDVDFITEDNMHSQCYLVMYILQAHGRWTSQRCWTRGWAVYSLIC